jgi:hypothetical protein
MSRRLDLSLFLSSNKTQTKSLLPCSLFMAKERQKPAMEEMVQKYLTEKDLLELKTPGTKVEKERDLHLDGREDLMLKLTFSLDDTVKGSSFF